MGVTDGLATINCNIGMGTGMGIGMGTGMGIGMGTGIE